MDDPYVTVEESRRAAYPLILCHRCLTVASVNRAVCTACEKKLNELAVKRLRSDYAPPGGKASLPEGGEDIYGGYPTQKEVFRKWADKYAKERRNGKAR